ncbi:MULTISPECIES: DUF3046 domain-containing protein [Sciscionella]|uniref:DUF3046 domain-containing protein n=1 Tax=Sciscionella TaxID=596495 RepID=UPI000475A505|nr:MULTISPECIES: DUF3046 domain-containing protein [Sciscionella]
MRMTVFRGLMAGEFGTARAELLADSHVFAELGGRTIDQALDNGYDPKQVWRTVCETFAIPKERR